MKKATAISTATRRTPDSPASPAIDTSMISALRIRSVRVAEATICFSASSALAVSSSSWSPWWEGSHPSFSRTFSPPSKHRYAPPATRRMGRSWGASQVRASATGRMMTSLLMREPRAIFAMIGSSRAGLSPDTYCGVTAVSSMTTPTAFEEAFTALEATSSMDEAVAFARVAISSSRATSPPDMSFPPMGLAWGASLGTRALYARGYA